MLITKVLKKFGGSAKKNLSKRYEFCQGRNRAWDSSCRENLLPKVIKPNSLIKV